MANEIRVLIAEDDVNTHEEWRESLAAWGFRGEIAEDGVRALELIGSFNPHILLSDLRMPRKGGLELLRDIRELGIDLPTIMISGQGEIPDAVEALKQGALDYLRKPVDPAHYSGCSKTSPTTSTFARRTRRCAGAWRRSASSGRCSGIHWRCAK